MAKVDMTEVWLKSLKPPTSSRDEYRDTRAPGLILRVTTKGAMSWSVVYRPRTARSKRRWTIGSYPATSLAVARSMAREAISAAERGEDIADRQRQAREAPLFVELAEDYIDRYASRKKSGNHDKRILEKDVLPKWARLKAEEIERRDVIHLLDAIVDRGAPIQANRTLACVRKLFNWAITRDLLQTNPCWNVPAPAKENRRDRVLDAEEIRLLWSGLENAKLAEASRTALRLVLLTAQRPGEVVNLKWEEIDEDGWWTIPAEKAKNGLSHRVPLSHFALGLIETLPRRSDFLFPSPSGEAPIHRSALTRGLNRSKPDIGVTNFSPHDLRRTAASHMTSLGITRIVVSKLLNHAEPGVTAVYDRYSYDKDKACAVAIWSEELRRILHDRSDAQVLEAAR